MSNPLALVRQNQWFLSTIGPPTRLVVLAKRSAHQVRMNYLIGDFAIFPMTMLRRTLSRMVL